MPSSSDPDRVIVLVVFALYLLVIVSASAVAWLRSRKALAAPPSSATHAGRCSSAHEPQGQNHVAAAVAEADAVGAAARSTQADDNGRRVLEQHFLGGRSFGLLVTMLTLAGTMYSGYSLIAVPADFARNGFVGVRWFGNTVSVQLGALVLLPRLRRLSLSRGYISPLAFLQDRWRSPVLTAFTVAAVTAPALLFLTAQVISLRDTVAAAFAGLLDEHATTVFLCALMVTYGWFGGILVSVEWGGFDDAKEVLLQSRPEWYSAPTRRGQLLMATYAFGAGAFIFNPFCITRVYAAKSYRSLAVAMSLVAVLEFVIKTPGMLLGIQGAAQLPGLPPGEVFAEVSFELMSKGWGALAAMSLLIVAAMAAIMSTADSSLMTLTNIAANDCVRRWRSDAPPWAFKGVGIVCMAVAIGLSYVFSDLAALWVLQNSLLAVGVAPCFVFGLFTPSMHAGTMCCGTCAGLVVALAGLGAASARRTGAARL